MSGAVELVKDFLWPRRCEVCGRKSDRPDRYICSDCMMRLKFNPVDGVCRICGRRAAGFEGEFLCEECRLKRPAFDRAAASLDFDDDTKKIVHAFKSKCAVYLRGDICDIVEGMLRTRFKTDLITAVTSVPLTLPHRFLRGYDQCAMMAKELARRINKPYVRLLKRQGFPKRQAGLSEEERIENVKGTFAVCRSFLRRLEDAPNSTVLVIDDVMTTSSTLNECAKTLKDAGVGTVWTATLAATHKD